MTTESVAATVRGVLHEVAPDADLATLDPQANLRDTLQLDSLDFLRVVELLSEQTGREISEDDYPKLNSLASTVKFLDGQ